MVISALVSFLIISGGNYDVAYAGLALVMSPLVFNIVISFSRYERRKYHAVYYVWILLYCWSLGIPAKFLPVQTTAYWLAPVLSVISVSVWIVFISLVTSHETDRNSIKPFVRRIAICQSFLVIVAFVGSLFLDIPWLS